MRNLLNMHIVRPILPLAVMLAAMHAAGATQALVKSPTSTRLAT